MNDEERMDKASDPEFSIYLKGETEEEKDAEIQKLIEKRNELLRQAGYKIPEESLTQTEESAELPKFYEK